MTVDLDALAKVLAAMTPGEWRPAVWCETDGEGCAAVGPVHSDDSDNESGGEANMRADADAAGVVALRNGAAELIRLARVGAAYLARKAANERLSPTTAAGLPEALAAGAALTAATAAATKEPT